MPEDTPPRLWEHLDVRTENEQGIMEGTWSLFGIVRTPAELLLAFGVDPRSICLQTNAETLVAIRRRLIIMRKPTRHPLPDWALVPLIISDDTWPDDMESVRGLPDKPEGHHSARRHAGRTVLKPCSKDLINPLRTSPYW